MLVKYAITSIGAKGVHMNRMQVDFWLEQVFRYIQKGISKYVLVLYYRYLKMPFGGNSF